MPGGYASRVDANQGDIVAALRDAGATVQPLHDVGRGVPDLLVGYEGRNLLMEVKDGSKPPSARKLTDQQVIWHGGWAGSVHVVTTPAEAVRLLDGVVPLDEVMRLKKELVLARRKNA